MASQSHYEIILSPEESVNVPVETSCLQPRPSTEGRIWPDPLNICNRGKSRQGVQLEVDRKVCTLLRNDKDRLLVFVEAVRKTIQRKDGDCLWQN